jgi:limonene-1,2-epoxide hydrolase
LIRRLSGVTQQGEACRAISGVDARYLERVNTLPGNVGGAVTPEDVVRAELHAWSGLDAAEIVSYFSPDGVWDNVALGVHRGHDEIRKAVEGYVKRMESTTLEIVNLAVNGNIVLTERVDRMVYDGNKISARCMGAFEVVGDKITAWRDYFDVP